MSKIANKITSRTSSLIMEAHKRLALPDMTSKVCNIIMVMTDSLIASRFLGTGAISAITLMAPITLFEAFLHNLLASGTTPVLIRLKSRGQSAEANRAFGAILSNTFFWFVFFFALIFFFSDNIFHLFSNDENLVADAIQYTIPYALLEPFSEAGLCLERGFKVDGRSGFFGFRGILASTLNLILDFVVVLVFHGGLLGLSLASMISSILGYFWSFTHMFSSKCTIHPDFSVLRSPEEFRKYLKEEFQIGHVYALDGGLKAGASSLMSKAYIVTGGTAALAAVGISGAINNVIASINGSMETSTFNLCNMFYSSKDYRGTVITLKVASIATAVFSAVAWIALNLFPEALAALYHVDSPEVMEALYPCLRFFTVTSIARSFLSLFSSFMLATGRPESARIISIAGNICVALSAVIGLTGIGFSALMAVYMLLSVALAAGTGLYLSRSTRVVYKAKDQSIRDYSFSIGPEGCPDAGGEVWKLCQDIPVLQPLSNDAPLLTEECTRLLQHVNLDSDDPIHVDFQVRKDDDYCVITIIDNGKLFDPLHAMKNAELPEDLAAARKLLLTLSPKASYSRVLELNVSHLVIPFFPERDRDRTSSRKRIRLFRSRNR